MKKRRWLAALLALVVMLAIVPIQAMAQDDAGATVYINGALGKDTNDGLTSATPVQTIGKALDLAGTGGTIVIVGTVYIRENVTIENVTVKRDENFKDAMFYLYTGYEATVKNAVIDGSSTAALNDGGYIFSTQPDSVLNIAENADVGNNGVLAINMNGSTLNMSGGRLHDNSDGEDNYNYGAAIWAYRNSVLNFTGGVVENNYSTDSGGALFAQEGCRILIDGTVFQNNRANYQGGAIYMETSSGDVTLEMNSGQIVNNYAGAYGGGIATYYWLDDAIVAINGGTISGNWQYVTDLSSAQPNTDDAESCGVFLFYSWDNYPYLYPVLKLSGSPVIEDPICMFDEGSEGPVIEVTGELNVSQPIVISDDYHQIGRTVIRYAAELTPDQNEFAGDRDMYGFAVNGQELQWEELLRVVFNTEDNLTTYEAIYLHPDSLIEAEKIPTPSKAGYTLEGWKRYGQDVLWNFADDVVTERMTLLASWKLNAPIASVDADRTSAHPGDTITLTAAASHELDDLTYSYEWYKDGVVMAGETGSTLKVTETGDYSVKVTAEALDTGETSSAESETVTCTFAHAFSEDWTSDADTHWHACSVCGEKNAEAAHTFEWVTDREATATEAGSKHEECTVCGYAKAAVEIPAIGKSDNTASPGTGDNSNIALWIAVVMAAGTALTGTVLYSRKKKYNR